MRKDRPVYEIDLKSIVRKILEQELIGRKTLRSIITSINLEPLTWNIGLNMGRDGETSTDFLLTASSEGNLGNLVGKKLHGLLIGKHLNKGGEVIRIKKVMFIEKNGYMGVLFNGTIYHQIEHGGPLNISTC